jgi:hypothetical protein
LIDFWHGLTISQFWVNGNPLLHLILYTTNKLEVYIKQTGEDKYLVKTLNMDINIPIDVLTGAGLRRISIDSKGVPVTSKISIQADPKVFYLKKVI